MRNISFHVYTAVLLLLIAMSGVSVSCGSKIESPRFPFYERDSMYITHTVREWSKQGHFFLKKPISLAEIHADTVLYSPDTLKIFSTIIFRFDGEQAYSGTSIIGYRTKNSSPWVLYEFGGGGVADTYDECSEITRWAFSDNIKGTGIPRYISHYGMYEREFWNDILFQKGKDIDSVYHFQLDVGTDHRYSVVRPYHKVEYPDSLGSV